MIGWYVHHVGLGHAARAAAVGAHLRHEVVGLGSGARPTAWPGSWVPLERDDEHAGTADALDVTAHGRLHWAPRHDAGLAARHARITRWLATARPSLVVVDVSVEVAVLCRLSGVPVVVVALPGDRTDAPHALAHDLAEALLAPWPAGTHEESWPRSWRDKTWCVGGIGRFDGVERTAAPARRDAPRVLLLWGSGGRAVTPDQVRAARAATPGWEWVERAPGSGADVLAELHAADVVVTHAGLGALAEVAAARRPAVVVAQPRPFDEQAASARVLDRHAIAVGLEEWPEAPAWPWLLDRARALGGDGWSRWSSGRGAASAAEHLDTLADRITATGGSTR